MIKMDGRAGLGLSMRSVTTRAVLRYGCNKVLVEVTMGPRWPEW